MFFLDSMALRAMDHIHACQAWYGALAAEVGGQAEASVVHDGSVARDTKGARSTSRSTVPRAT